jgi:hypothetical protein
METPMTSRIFELGQTLQGYAVPLRHKTIGQLLNAGL